MKRLALILGAVFAATGISAKVTLPKMFADGMVMQRETNANLWGKAKASATVKITTSWNKKTYSVKADSNGKWKASVSTPEAGGPYSITLSDGEKTVLNNILIGEVWICSGQSNMEMPIKGFENCPVEGYNDVVADAVNSSLVRFVKIPSVMSMTPLSDANCEWKVCSPATVGDASATGYFFARKVSRMLNVPVGLIMANKGGSKVESWLTKENLKKYTDEPVDSQAIVKKYPADYHRALMWGNGTFSPILKYTVKGILFYQGCSNVGDPGNQYSDRLALLVRQWRDAFGCGEIPFYFVQIAPYDYGNVDADWGAKLREQQVRARDIIPNSGLVCTNDCVYPWEARQIHPAQKQKVGERLAFLALNKTYGQETILCESPEFKDLKIEGDTCCIRLKNDYGGVSRLDDMQGFEVAGADKVFHPAKASYDNAKGIVVTCPEVKAPVAVRYCFKNFQLGNVANMGGLPLLPFRTDNW